MRSGLHVQQSQGGAQETVESYEVDLPKRERGEGVRCYLHSKWMYPQTVPDSGNLMMYHVMHPLS